MLLVVGLSGLLPSAQAQRGGGAIGTPVSPDYKGLRTDRAYQPLIRNNVTPPPVKVAPISDCSALGAAIMGAIGSGLELPSPSKGATSYKPAMPADRVRALHEGWTRAVESVIENSGAATREHHLVEVKS